MADKERIGLFIDGANLYSCAKELGFDIDYKKLLKEFRERGHLIRAYYYTVVPEDREDSIRPLIDFLDYNGYDVATRLVREHTDSFGQRRLKGNMGIELAVTAMKMAERIDHMVLFSGNGDFRALVQAIKEKGVRVSVVSTLDPNMIADDLRREADEFIDLADLRKNIVRNPDERGAHEEERRATYRGGRSRQVVQERSQDFTA